MEKTNFDIYQWFLLVHYTLNIKKYEYPNGYSYFLVRETGLSSKCISCLNTFVIK